MDFDVQELSAEIRQIDNEYRQTHDHFREVYGRGRGRGRGRFRGRGRGRPFGRGVQGTDRGRWNEAEVVVSEPRVASSIAGAYKDDIQRDFIPPVILKRPAVHGLEDDPKMKNRNRRMFSSLLTTLEKFREENDTVEKSERWKKREEITKRAEQKTVEESVRLREKQKKEWEEQKQQETEKLKELDLMRKVKGLQLIYAKRLNRQELLLNYLATSTEPAIYWLPAKHSDATQAMMDANAAEHALWKDEQQKTFEKEKLMIENGEPLEEEPEKPKIKSTIHVAEKQAESGAEDDEELQFQPVSELNNEVPIETKDMPSDEAPAAKKAKLNDDEDEKSLIHSHSFDCLGVQRWNDKRGNHHLGASFGDNDDDEEHILD